MFLKVIPVTSEKLKKTLSEGERQKTLDNQKCCHEKVQNAILRKYEDVAEAKSEVTKKVLIFDLQKTYPTTLLSTNVAYYK